MTTTTTAFETMSRYQRARWFHGASADEIADLDRALAAERPHHNGRAPEMTMAEIDAKELAARGMFAAGSGASALVADTWLTTLLARVAELEALIKMPEPARARVFAERDQAEHARQRDAERASKRERIAADVAAEVERAALAGDIPAHVRVKIAADATWSARPTPLDREQVRALEDAGLVGEWLTYAGPGQRAHLRPIDLSDGSAVFGARTVKLLRRCSEPFESAIRRGDLIATPLGDEYDRCVYAARMTAKWS